MATGTAIKIGRSNNLDERKQTLQVANEEKLTLLYKIENVQESFEQHIHEVCYRYKIRGEWFELTCINHLLQNPWFKENMIKC